MPVRVLLLADDLTGACDAGVHFAMRGLPTAAAITLENARGDMPVWSVNLESRDLERPAIERLFGHAGSHVPTTPETIIFKKIDSTLRGNAGIETAEAMKAFGCDAAVFTPALPALGRTVENGILRIFGNSAVEVSAYLRDQEVNLPCSDAVCDADLDRIVAEGMITGRRILWAGSAGLAAALARALKAPAQANARQSEYACAIPSTGPIVFYIGSTHRATTMQVDALQAAAADDIALFPVPRGRVTPAEIRSFACTTNPAALVLSGGDTASLVCRALGAIRIDLTHEIIPGVPYGILRGGVAEGTPVATKSGGFGAPDALIQVAEFFRCFKNQIAFPPSR